ncbi:MAG: hypothetical protein AAB376_02165 [Pseudomonadota bacterium]|mgnify:CR=1 FL=1
MNFSKKERLFFLCEDTLAGDVEVVDVDQSDSAAQTGKAVIANTPPKRVTALSLTAARFKPAAENNF